MVLRENLFLPFLACNGSWQSSAYSSVTFISACLSTWPSLCVSVSSLPLLGAPVIGFKGHSTTGWLLLEIFVLILSSKALSPNKVASRGFWWIWIRRGGHSLTHYGGITVAFNFLICVLRYFFFLCLCIIFIIRNLKTCNFFWKNLSSVVGIKRIDADGHWNWRDQLVLYGALDDWVIFTDVISLFWGAVS